MSLLYTLSLVLTCLIGLSKCVFDPPPQTPVPDEHQTSMLYFIPPDAIIASSVPFIAKIEDIARAYVADDYDGVINTSIGKIQIDITNMEVTAFDIGDLNLDNNSNDNSIYAYINDNNFSMSFDYAIQELGFPYKSESGYGTVSTDNLSLAATVSATKIVETGSADIKDTIDIDVGDFTINMQGGLVANVIQALDSLFADVVNKMISDTFSQFIDDYIRVYLDQLADHGYYSCNHEVSCIDYRLTRDPSVTSEGLYVFLSGVMYNGDHQDKMVPLDFIDLIPVSTQYYLSIQFQNASFQSMLSTLFAQNFLSLSNPETNNVEPITLSYDDIVKYLPQWASAYPDGTSGQLSVIATDTPSSQIMYNGLKIGMNSHVSLTPTDQIDTTSISTDVKGTYLGDVWWRKYHHTNSDITEDVEKLSIEMSLVSFSSSNVSVSSDWLEYVINDQLLPQINQHFYDNTLNIYSFPGIRYTSPSITYNSDYVLVNANYILS